MHVATKQFYCIIHLKYLWFIPDTTHIIWLFYHLWFNVYFQRRANDLKARSTINSYAGHEVWFESPYDEGC
jgi:hypothetical protein